MEAQSDISFPFKSDRRAAWREEEERLEAKTRKKSARLSQSFYGRDNNRWLGVDGIKSQTKDAQHGSWVVPRWSQVVPAD